MDGVLILAHGSKKKETEETLNSIVNKVKDKTGLEFVVPAYLQFSEQNLLKGIEELVDNGVNNIKIIPMFLFDGIHVTQDIPEELDRVMSLYPGVSIKMSSYLGNDDRIADIIIDRINSL
ncbi:MAG: sirohydrochlorin chelatase [Acetivibrionales bacterium]|jgi:sirohydrochlorin ferrochelatase